MNIRYGGVSFTGAAIRRAAVRMQSEDTGQRDIPRELEYYDKLLDLALQELFLVTDYE